MLVEFKNLAKKTRIVWKSRGVRSLNYYIVNYITKKPVGTRPANIMLALKGVWHKLSSRFPPYLTLCLENSPSELKLTTSLFWGFFLFTPFILNGLELLKSERIQRVFFEWNFVMKLVDQRIIVKTHWVFLYSKVTQ